MEECPSGRRGPTRNRLREVTPPFGGSNPSSSAFIVNMKKKNRKLAILQILEASKEPISGENLGKLLGISRTAVWKNIQQLKKAGYNIVSTPRGYLLMSSDELCKESFEDLPVKVFCFDSLDSTMSFARKLGEKGEEALVIAETQTQGRGRLGRDWKSPKGGLWMSFVIKKRMSLKDAFFLTYAASIATAEAVTQVTEIPAFVKWPNDVLVKEGKKEKKLAGILLELSAEVDELKYAVIGIGINANNPISHLEPGATSIKELKGFPVNRYTLVKTLVNILFDLLKLSPVEVVKLWKKKSLTLGRSVKIIQPQGELIGIAIDIADDGALVLQTPEMEIKKIYSGDCIHATLI